VVASSEGEKRLAEAVGEFSHAEPFPWFATDWTLIEPETDVDSAAVKASINPIVMTSLEA
jgi:hypothetical protein